MRRMFVLAAAAGVAFAACDRAPLSPEFGENEALRPPFSPTFSATTAVWEAEGLGTLGGNSGEAWAVNDAGWVVGLSATVAGSNNAFLWDGEEMQGLGTLGGSRSSAYGVNSDGVVVGEAQTTAGDFRAFRWVSPGPMTELPALEDMDHCIAVDINDAETIVGACADAERLIAVVWKDGAVDTAIEGTEEFPSLFALAINEDDQVAGVAFTSDFLEFRAFLWTESDGLVMLDTPEGTPSFANGLNGAGQVAGGTGKAFEDVAARWTGGVRQDLGVPEGSLSSHATDIDDNGGVVGHTGIFTSTVAWYWSDENGMVDIGTIPGGTGAAAYGINRSGTAIVGIAFGGGEFNSQPVIWRLEQIEDPEPGCSIDGLRQRVAGLEADGTLSNRQARPLYRYLDQAEQSIARGESLLDRGERFADQAANHFARAADRLRAFILEVRDLEAQGVLEPDDAAALVECAQELIDELEA